MPDPKFDSNGYPTEQAYLRISCYQGTDVNEWLDYCVACWNTTYGAVRQHGADVEFATGGWSGNETIAGAMEENFLMRAISWESSHRGGLHIYRKRAAPAAGDKSVRAVAERHGIDLSRVKEQDIDVLTGRPFASDFNKTEPAGGE